jgi:PAS domain S-box-containing protein
VKDLGLDSSRSKAQPTAETFQRLVDAVTDYALYMLDPGGQILTWNRGAQRIKGYISEEIMGAHFSCFFTREDQDAGLPARALTTAAREGRFEAEGWRVRKDGSRFWAHAILDVIYDDDGSVAGFAKITRDITERKEREDALRESERRFQLLVSSVEDYAIYMLDTQGTVTSWNSGARAIKGYDEEEALGQHFSLFYTEEDRARGAPDAALNRALEEGKFEAEAQRVRKDGSLFWAQVLIDPIYNETGKHIGFAKITRDISERKRTEEELRHTQEALLQSQKLQALGELAGGIAHDFNNLMTVIRGSADFMLRQPDMSSEKRNRYLNVMLETSERATTLTSQLLAFARCQPLEPEVIDLNVRLDILGEMFQRTLGNLYCLELELAPTLWLVEIDPTGLETALLNVVVNARDAMPQGGEITISTRNVTRNGVDGVTLSIRDTGEGMPPETLQRVFEPFFTTKPIGKGTGLGLSQIHGYAVQSGGSARIESEVGRGTLVELWLPRTHKRQRAKVAVESPAVIPRGLKVLVVEDSEHVRCFARQLLEDLGCLVIEASSGAEALELLEWHTVDLVFSDIVMPGMSGLELAQQVKIFGTGVPVLLASGYSSEKFLPKDEREFPILRKPYEIQALAAAINQLLGTTVI